MEIEKSKVLIKFLLIFRQSGDVLFFLNVRKLRGYTATDTVVEDFPLVFLEKASLATEKVTTVFFFFLEFRSVWFWL